MKVHVLGTGTSTGVPTIGCDCHVCTSNNPKNKRLRCSLYIETEKTGLLIDTGPDLRQQALRAGIKKVDSVLYTHSHADHVFGIDDLRPFNFISKKSIPVYANQQTAEELEKNFYYCFHQDPNYEGGNPPRLVLKTVKPNQELTIQDIKVTPLSVFHGQLEVIAYRIRDFAYITDCSLIPEETKAKLQGLDTLIIDGLRNRPHNTHFSVEQAVQEIMSLKPKHAFLTHISHELDHEEENRKLSKIKDVKIELAYDGMVLEF